MIFIRVCRALRILDHKVVYIGCAPNPRNISHVYLNLNQFRFTCSCLQKGNRIFTFYLFSVSVTSGVGGEDKHDRLSHFPAGRVTSPQRCANQNSRSCAERGRSALKMAERGVGKRITIEYNHEDSDTAGGCCLSTINNSLPELGRW